MVEKQIIVLARSRKIGGICLAGIDTSNGQWVRLVSNDARTDHAIPSCNMRDNNSGQIIQLLDVISANCIKKQEDYIHPENWIADTDRGFHVLRKSGMDEVLKLHPCDDYPTVYGNIYSKVSKTNWETYIKRYEKPHSLMLIRVDRKKLYNNEDMGDKVVVLFDYNGDTIKWLSLTDGHEMDHKVKSDEYGFDEDTYLVISIGKPYQASNDREEYYYKFVASVIPDPVPYI